MPVCLTELSGVEVNSSVAIGFFGSTLVLHHGEGNKFACAFQGVPLPIHLQEVVLPITDNFLPCGLVCEHAEAMTELTLELSLVNVPAQILDL